MASAQEQFDYINNDPMSFEDYWHTHSPYTEGHAMYNPEGFLAKVGNFFTGEITSAKQAYENYLSDWEFNRNQQVAANSAKAQQEREDTEIQRRMADYQAAGLNPYILVNGSGISGSSSPVPYAKHERTRKSTEAEDNKLFSSALKILALILLKKS